jgi:hypothetical protein
MQTSHYLNKLNKPFISHLQPNLANLLIGDHHFGYITKLKRKIVSYNVSYINVLHNGTSISLFIVVNFRPFVGEKT